ncbi:MAG TPA: hypothetical protein VJ801_01840 [Polyangia bacterium]|jgi:hypothetical protein|nr:hypothetical protein [Polyangia bacterium]
MEQEDLKAGYRRAWILVLVGALYVAGFLALALRTNIPARPAGWDMGGTPFVPASSIEADGYYKASGLAPPQGKRP